MPTFRPWLAVAISIAAPSPAIAEGAFDAKAICRTAIAAITGRDLKLFQATDAPDGVVALTYARPFDNFVWAYHCRLEGNRVIWADEPGRWRQEAKDDRIFFESRRRRRAAAHHQEPGQRTGHTGTVRSREDLRAQSVFERSGYRFA